MKEISKELLNCNIIKISTGDLIIVFPVEAPSGTPFTPPYSFASNPESGFCLDTAGVLFGVDAQVGLVTGPHGNVAIGGIPSSYGGGEGVVFLAEATVHPVGIPNAGNGGIIYTTNTGLWYHNADGLTIKLSEAGTGNLSGPLVSTENELARYADATGHVITSSGVFYRGTQLQVGAGLMSAPAYGFTAYPTTGLYLPAANHLAFVANATEGVSLSTTALTCHVPVRVPNGTALLPTLSFSSAPTTGLHFTGSDLAFSAQGVNALQLCPDANTVLAGTNTNFGNGQGVLKISTATTVPVGVPNGGSGGILYVDTTLRWLSASGVSVRVGGDVVGAGTVVTDTLLVWSDTTGTAVLSRGVITNTGSIRAHQGTNPAYSFLGDTTTGLALISNTLRFQGGNITFLDVSATTLTFAQQVLFEHPATSSMSFTSSTTTGVYSTGASVTTLSVNGVIGSQWDADRNLSLRGVGTYENGEGVILIPSGTAPTTAPSGGAFLYVQGNDLCWRSPNNTEFILTTPHIVASATTSTPKALVRFNGTDGATVQNSAVLLTDQGQVQSQGYCFGASPTTGLFSPMGNTLRLENNGVAAVSFTGTGLTVENGQVLQIVNGTVSSPAIAFTTNPTGGLYLDTPNTGALCINGVRALSCGPHHNVTFGSDLPDFAGGQGVVYFSQVVTPPTTTVASGGMLYVSGRTLMFYNDQGLRSTLTGVQTPTLTTPNAVARFDGILGHAIQNTSALTITDAGQFLVPNGTPSAPGYTVVNTTGISLSSAMLQLGVGASALNISSSAVESLVAMAADSLRVGGPTGATVDFTTPSVVFAGASTYSWAQNGTTIMQTEADGTLNLLTRTAKFSGATGTLTFGAYDGTNYSITTSHVNDAVTFRNGTTDVLRVGNGVATISTVETLSNVRAPYYTTPVPGVYGFTASGSQAGMDMSSQGIRLRSKGTGFQSRGNTQLSLLNEVNIVTGDRTIAWGAAITPPSTLPSSGVFMYQLNGNLMRVANTYADVAINGPHARSKWTRTVTIVSGSDTLVTSVVNDTTLTNVMSVTSSTITGTAFTAGWWEVTAHANWAFNATGYRKIRIFIDSVEVGASVQNAVTVSGVNTQHQVSVCVNVGQNAVMTVYVYQTSLDNLNVTLNASAVLLG